MSSALTAALLAATGGKQVTAEEASVPRGGSKTNVAEGGEDDGQGGSAVLRRLQGNCPNPLPSTCETHTREFRKYWGGGPYKGVLMGQYKTKRAS